MANRAYGLGIRQFSTGDIQQPGWNVFDSCLIVSNASKSLDVAAFPYYSYNFMGI